MEGQTKTVSNQHEGMEWKDYTDIDNKNMAFLQSQKPGEQENISGSK